MNWIEACKSGRKFRAPEWDKGLFYQCQNGSIYSAFSVNGSTVEEIYTKTTLRDDFEFVEDEPRECWVVFQGEKCRAVYRDHSLAKLYCGSNEAYKIVHMREVKDG